MIDFAIGVAIGFIAALATCGAWALRLNHGSGPPWMMLSGAAAGYAGGLVGVFVAFCWLLAEAFRPR